MIRDLPELNLSLGEAPISFSAYYSMQNCILKGVILNRSSFSDTDNKDLVCGNIFHTLVSEIDDYRKVDPQKVTRKILSDIDDQVEKYREKSGNPERYNGVRHWSKLNHIFKTILEKSKEEVSPDSLREISITHSNNKIFGIIDLLENAGDSTILVDYKSSKYTEFKEVPQQYILQLHFYSLLVKDKYGSYPKKAFIEYFYSERVEVEIQKEVCKQIISKTNDIFDRLSKIRSKQLDITDISFPSIENCNNCNCSFICPTYINKKYSADKSSKCFTAVPISDGKMSEVGFQLRHGVIPGLDLVKVDGDFEDSVSKGSEYIFNNVDMTQEGIIKISNDSEVFVKS